MGSVAARLPRDWRLIVGGTLVVIFLAMAVAPGLFTSVDPTKTDFRSALVGPSARHWFGTDELGRDLYARVVYGARVSFLIAVGALAGAASVGTALGLAAGYAGGSTDEVVMRLLDVLMSFPGVLLAIAIAAGLGPGTRNIALAMGVYTMPTFARLVRASTLAIKEREFVTAVRSLGASEIRIVGRHILPNIYATTILTQVVVRAGIVILSAAGLGFIGLSVQPPQPEWGEMISDGRSYLGAAPHLMLLPGAVLMLAVLSFNLVGDWLQDVTDPRRKARGGRRKDRAETRNHPHRSRLSIGLAPLPGGAMGQPGMDGGIGTAGAGSQHRLGGDARPGATMPRKPGGGA
jgi:peptide/nickel transport system permease protein